MLLIVHYFKDILLYFIIYNFAIYTFSKLRC